MLNQILLFLLVWLGSGLICAGFIYSSKISRYLDNPEITQLDNKRNRESYYSICKDYFDICLVSGPISFIPILFNLNILSNDWQSPYFKDKL
jgi:hypothetical protein